MTHLGPTPRVAGVRRIALSLSALLVLGACTAHPPSATDAISSSPTSPQPETKTPTKGRGNGARSLGIENSPDTTTGDASVDNGYADPGTYVFKVVAYLRPPTPNAETQKSEGTEIVEAFGPRMVDGRRVQRYQFTGFTYGDARWDHFLQRRKDGLYLVDLRIGSPGQDGSWKEDQCQLNRPFLWWPATPGTTSSGAVACSQGTNTYEFSLSAIGEAKVRILEKRYRAIVFDRTTKWRFVSGDDETSGEGTARYWFVPELAIVVRWRPPGTGDVENATVGKLVRYEPS